MLFQTLTHIPKVFILVILGLFGCQTVQVLDQAENLPPEEALAYMSSISTVIDMSDLVEKEKVFSKTNRPSFFGNDADKPHTTTCQLGADKTLFQIWTKKREGTKLYYSLKTELVFPNRKAKVFFFKHTTEPLEFYSLTAGHMHGDIVLISIPIQVNSDGKQFGILDTLEESEQMAAECQYLLPPNYLSETRTTKIATALSAIGFSIHHIVIE